MFCPRCGYLMSALDEDCARCRNFGAAPAPAAPNALPSAVPPSSWNAPPPQTQAFMPMNASTPQQPYTPPGAYTPYPPAPYTHPAYQPSRLSQGLSAVLGALLIVGVVGLRIYLYEARQQRRDEAMLNLNAHYNDTMRRQFDAMQMQGQRGAQQAQQDVSDAMRNDHGMSVNSSSATTITVTSQQPATTIIAYLGGMSPAQQMNFLLPRRS